MCTGSAESVVSRGKTEFLMKPLGFLPSGSKGADEMVM